MKKLDEEVIDIGREFQISQVLFVNSDTWRTLECFSSLSFFTLYSSDPFFLLWQAMPPVIHGYDQVSEESLVNNNCYDIVSV